MGKALITKDIQRVMNYSDGSKYEDEFIEVKEMDLVYLPGIKINLMKVIDIEERKTAWKRKI